MIVKCLPCESIKLLGISFKKNYSTKSKYDIDVWLLLLVRGATWPPPSVGVSTS